jgi:hypothetical protein
MHAWLESLGRPFGSFERSYFYSDSHNDIPLLSVVSHPVATNPSATLSHTQPPTAGLYSICSMIKKFIRKILGVKDERDPTQPSSSAPSSMASTRNCCPRTRSASPRPCRKPASRPSSSAAPCATCCWA